MSATRTVGVVVLVGGAGAAAWMLLSDGNPFADAVSEVTTRYSGGGDGLNGQAQDDSSSTPGPSRAQQLQNLEKDMSRLESEIASERSSIEAEYERRMARATFEGLADEVKVECAGRTRVFWNPYGDCDDQYLADYKADTRAWKSEQINRRVRPLERELGAVEAEHESLLLTA